MAGLGKITRMMGAVLAVGLTLTSTFAQAREPSAPLSAYGHLPSLEDAAISPDGTRLAFVKTSDNSRSLLIVDLATSKVLGGAHAGNTKLREVFWQDNDQILAVVSTTSGVPFGFQGPTQEWYQVIRYTISTNKMQAIDFNVLDQDTFNVLNGNPEIREVEGKNVLFLPGLYVGGTAVLPALFAFNGLHGRGKIIARGDEPITDWLLDEAGGVAVEFTYHDGKKTWGIRTHRDNRMVTVASGQEAIDPPSLLGFDSTGEQAIVAFVEKGEAVWRPISLKDGVLGAPLAQGASLQSVITDPRNSRIIGGVLNSDDSHYVFFDNELQAHWNAILRAFPKDTVHLVSHSADFSKVILKVFGPEDGYSYAYFDWYTHSANLLGHIYHDVQQTAEIRKVTYAAGDGLAISAFLTLPRGVAEKNLPLIMMPHGGPAARDTGDFDWWAQAVADQGYAVLQPNFRGSDIDSDFMAAGYGEWGRKMQTDLSDGVQYLAKQGIIDPSRVCIVGASYGGYAALAGVTLQSGIYRCAVSVSGPSDLPRMRSWTRDGHLGMVNRYWERFWGVGERDNDILKSISPVDHVQDVTVPILLIHGRDDTVVPYEQSDVMLSALKKAGKPVEMVTLKHEDHWLSTGDTRLQMLESSVAFLRTHNPP
jgi:dipeptidyl aminopeptidase/acylaminoacyl peptidase